MQGRQGTAGYECQDEAANAQHVIHSRQGSLGLMFAIQHPAQVEHHDSEQIGGTTEEIE